MRKKQGRQTQGNVFMKKILFMKNILGKLEMLNIHAKSHLEMNVLVKNLKVSVIGLKRDEW